MPDHLFHYYKYNKHRKDLPAENTAVYIKVTVSIKRIFAIRFATCS